MATNEKDLGIQALRSGDPRGAVTHLTQAAQQAPSDASVFGYLGAAYAQCKMPEQAIQHLSHAVRLAPQSAALRFNLAMAQEHGGNAAAALESYRQAVHLEPGHERARAAIARLSGGAPAAGFAVGPGAVPAPGGAVEVSSFVLPGAPASAPAAPSHTPYGPPPNIYAQPPAPRGTVAGGADPTLIGQAPSAPILPSAPLGGLPPVPGASYAPPEPPGPPAGLRPLGDWTPPEGSAPPAASQPWQPAPPRPANVQHLDSQVAVISAPERAQSRSYHIGSAYLMGMGSGVWWGLLGAVFIFLYSLLNPAAQLMQLLPIVITMCAMAVAGGALVYGLIGMWGAASDDAETLCGNAGAAVGVFTSLFILPFIGGVMLMYTVGTPVIGTVWVARMFGKGLGKRIGEMDSSVTVVTGAGGVAVTRVR